LAAAWRRVAGEAIASRTRATGIRRGVLEIVCDDERWLDALASAIPRLAARLARERPDLGVRRFRLRREGHERDGRPIPLPTEDEAREASETARPPEDTGLEREVPLPAADQAARLAAAMERYLRRTSRR
jgi:hypothetical protein